MKAKVIITGEIVDVYHESQHGQITNIYKESVLVNGRMWTEDELDFCVKATEAPEKIYLFENPIDGTPDYRWLSKRSCSDDVEYTRTDVFIEKAVEYIANNMRCDGYTLQTKVKFIRKFRNYMEGE